MTLHPLLTYNATFSFTISPVFGVGLLQFWMIDGLDHVGNRRNELIFGFSYLPWWHGHADRILNAPQSPSRNAEVLTQILIWGLRLSRACILACV